jgi:hypothetical protein
MTALNKSSSASTSSAPIVAAASTFTIVALIVRWIQKRANTPMVRARLQCICGKVQGEVAAIPQDSIQIYCYCQDCRAYAAFVRGAAQQQQHGGTKTTSTTTGSVNGGCNDCTLIVQVCKSSLTLSQGLEQLQLARKSPTTPGMHRYYAKCCCTPLFNTVQQLGFVGVFMDCLTYYPDERQHFAGPILLYTESATVTKTFPPLPKMNWPDTLWKLLRYMPYSSAGPFDYNQEPVYWGSDSSSSSHKDKRI